MREETCALVESVRPFLPTFLHDPDYDAELVLSSVLILYLGEHYPELKPLIADSLMRGVAARTGGTPM